MSQPEETAIQAVVPVQAPETVGVSPTAWPSEDRLPEPDLIRGVTILGILLINISFFSFPTQGMDPQVKCTWWGDDLVQAFTTAFVAGKMMSQLAILFGIGLALQTDRARLAGRPFTGYYLRRQFLLFILGLAHALLLWYGDILASYALVGMLALVISWLGRRGVFWFMVGCLAFIYGLMAIFVTLAIVFGSARAEKSAEKETDPLAQLNERVPLFRDYFGKENEQRIYSSGTWPEMVVNRALNVAWYFIILAIMLAWYYLACFLIGILLVWRGVLYDPEATRPFMFRLTVVMLSIGLSCALVSFGLSLADAFSRDGDQRGRVGMIAAGLSNVTMLPMAIGYFGLLLWWSRSQTLPWLQARLRAVGRMALTNYLMQSVLCGIIFYSYGFALFGQVGPAAGLLVVLAIWLLELLWSPIWLKYFLMGPVEWAWRSLADGRLRPFLRTA